MPLLFECEMCKEVQGEELSTYNCKNCGIKVGNCCEHEILVCDHCGETFCKFCMPEGDTVCEECDSEYGLSCGVCKQYYLITEDDDFYDFYSNLCENCKEITCRYCVVVRFDKKREGMVFYCSNCYIPKPKNNSIVTKKKKIESEGD
jgi:hypothetical protein